MGADTIQKHNSDQISDRSKRAERGNFIVTVDVNMQECLESGVKLGIMFKEL